MGTLTGVAWNALITLVKFLFYVAGLTGSQVLYQQKKVFHHLKKNFNHETNLRHKNTFWMLTKRIRKELRKEKTFFLFSAKDLDLVNFSKNSKDTYIGPINLRAIFPVKKVYTTSAIFAA